MAHSIAMLTLVVRDYDEAIAFFTDALRFTLVEDTPLSADKRWVVVAPPASRGAALLLAKAATPEQLAHAGNQTGGRVFLFLHTDDFWDDYQHMRGRGVRFAEEPREEVYGRVVVFFDLYGNKWDLVQPNHTGGEAAGSASPHPGRCRMVSSPTSQKALARKVYGRALPACLALWALLFLPAGTLAYWEAWIYLAILLIPMFAVFRYLLKYDPQLLERRMQMREREAAQKRLMVFSTLYFLLAFTLPGFDRRWGWSDVPVVVVLAADVLVMLGYGLFVLVLRENQYAARTIQVEAGQQVIRSGPYAYVRHPMYLGVTVMYAASPLALGSYWALLPALLIIPILVARIVNEEKVLERDLPGYREYKQATRYRLVPGVW